MAALTGWLISEYEFAADWPTWEMHPNGDELVYLLSGSADLVLDRPEGLTTLPLRGSAAVVVPRGVGRGALGDRGWGLRHVRGRSHRGLTPFLKRSQVG